MRNERNRNSEFSSIYHPVSVSLPLFLSKRTNSILFDEDLIITRITFAKEEEWNFLVNTDLQGYRILEL